jgi:hypothetical protein
MTAATCIDRFLPTQSLRKPAAKAPAKDPADIEAVIPPWHCEIGSQGSMYLQIAIGRVEEAIVLFGSNPCRHGGNIEPE